MSSNSAIGHDLPVWLRHHPFKHHIANEVLIGISPPLERPVLVPRVGGLFAHPMPVLVRDLRVGDDLGGVLVGERVGVAVPPQLAYVRRLPGQPVHLTHCSSCGVNGAHGPTHVRTSRCTDTPPWPRSTGVTACLTEYGPNSRPDAVRTPHSVRTLCSAMRARISGAPHVAPVRGRGRPSAIPICTSAWPIRSLASSSRDSSTLSRGIRSLTAGEIGRITLSLCIR